MSSKTSFFALLLFGLLSLSTAVTLSATLTKTLLFVGSNNALSQELSQTPNGVIAHSINSNGISQYSLLNLASKDATPILSSIVTACETAPATFQHLHYHTQSNSLVYFCSQNTSLLVIDQSTYGIETSIPFTLTGSWPSARLSTEGSNVVILGLDISALSTSMLAKVDMTTKQVTTEILLNQGLPTGEAVVAYASGSVATNKIDGTDLITTVYSFALNGNTSQLTSISSFTSAAAVRVITKLFVVGDHIITNNAQDLYFIDQQGVATQKGQVHVKTQGQFAQPSFTAQADGGYLYVLSASSSADKYSVVNNAIVTENIGSFGEIQVAFGYGTTADLLFALDSTAFRIINLQTSQIIYTAFSSYDDLMLTNSTYGVVRSNFLSLYDLNTDALISTATLGQKYYYNKDQYIISYLNSNTTYAGCWLEHVNLVTGQVWTTKTFTTASGICSSYVFNLRITPQGTVGAVFPVASYYLVITEQYSYQIYFEKTLSGPTEFDSVLIDFDALELYYFIADNFSTQLRYNYYTFNPVARAFRFRQNRFENGITVQPNGFFPINTKVIVALSPNALIIYNGIYTTKYPITTGWNLVTAFKDSSDTQFMLGTSTTGASLPAVFAVTGEIISLPGTRASTVKAQAAGPKSYWIEDNLGSAFGLVRFYTA